MFETRFAILVVDLAFLAVGEGLVGVGEFFEFRFGFNVARVFVCWVMC